MKKSRGVNIFMIIMLCILFFMLGYGYSVRDEVNEANQFIAGFIKEYPCPIIGGSYNGEYEFNLNFTQYT